MEVAQEYELAVRTLPASGIVRHRDGPGLTVRDDVIGVIGADSVVREFPTENIGV